MELPAASKAVMWERRQSKGRRGFTREPAALVAHGGILELRAASPHNSDRPAVVIVAFLRCVSDDGGVQLHVAAPLIWFRRLRALFRLRRCGVLRRYIDPANGRRGPYLSHGRAPSKSWPRCDSNT